MEVTEQQLKKLVAAEVEKAMEANVPKWCFTCIHFKFRKTGTRVCQCPDSEYKGKVKEGVCVNWKLEPRRERRVKRFA